VGEEMSRVRDPLFSVHTTDSGSICLYLEETDACIDLVEDVVGQVELQQLDELQAANRTSFKAEGYVEQLDQARDEMPEMALRIAIMSEDEAYNLCQDIITSIKKRRIFNADEMSTKVAKLRVVE
jgi:hypothetical protein